MKTINWIFTITMAVALIGCDKASNLAEVLSAADVEALEEMEHAYEGAKAYQDTLVWCVDTSQTCTDSTIAHYEDELHGHLDEWDEFHAIYSHNNLEDDHHHGSMVQHTHGVVEEHEEEAEEEDHGHNLESHYQLNEFISEHEPYHTE